MAIFNKPDQQTDLKTHSTIISASTKVNGTITSDCTLHIDGAHEGIVNAKGTVTIGSSGKINGDVAANKLTITGLFHGTADCENVEIRAGGTLRGKVISNNLTIDSNCSFEGESVKKSQLSAAPNNSRNDATSSNTKTAPKIPELATKNKAS